MSCTFSVFLISRNQTFLPNGSLEITLVRWGRPLELEDTNGKSFSVVVLIGRKNKLCSTVELKATTIVMVVGMEQSWVSGSPHVFMGFPMALPHFREINAG